MLFFYNDLKIFIIYISMNFLKTLCIHRFGKKSSVSKVTCMNFKFFFAWKWTYLLFPFSMDFVKHLHPIHHCRLNFSQSGPRRKSGVADWKHVSQVFAFCQCEIPLDFRAPYVSILSPGWEMTLSSEGWSEGSLEAALCGMCGGSVPLACWLGCATSRQVPTLATFLCISFRII